MNELEEFCEQKIEPHSIENLKNKVKAPLSFTQERFWFLSEYEEGTVYRVPSLMKFVGNLNIDILELSLAKIVERHSILRTNFMLTDNHLMQSISDEKCFTLDTLKCSLELMHDEIDTYLSSSISLEKDSLFMAKLYEISPKENYLFLSGHNTVMDGISEDILYKELSVFYTAYTNEEDSLPLPLSLQYIDYANMERKYWSESKLKEGLSYWVNELKGIPELELKISDKEPKNKSFKGKAIHFEVDDDTTQKLYEVRKANNTTLLKTLFSVYSVLLHRYSNQDDIVIGILSGNRHQPDFECNIGPFSNALAIKQNYNKVLNFNDVLNEVTATFTKALEYEYVPFAEIVKKLNLKKEITAKPVFQTMFELNKDKNGLCSLPQLDIDITRVETMGAKFDLSLSMTVKNGKLFGFFEYATDTFSTQDITSFVKNFQFLLKAIAEDASKDIYSYKLYDKKYNKSKHYIDALWKCKNRAIQEISNPELPIKSINKYEDSKTLSLKTQLTKDKWVLLEKKCTELRIDSNKILTALFSKVLIYWSKKSEFSLRILQENIVPSIDLYLTSSMSLAEIYETVNRELEDIFSDLTQSEREELFIEYSKLKDVNKLFIAISSNIRGKALILDENLLNLLWLRNDISLEDECITIEWIYKENLFESNVIEEMFKAYENLIKAFIDDISIFETNSLNLLPKDQKNQRLAYNDTTKHLNEENLLSQIAKIASRFPNNEAVYTKTQSLTYLQLHNAAIAIARYIESKDLEVNSHVGIILPKGWAQIVAVIGVGYAGMAYLPIEVNTPPARIETILKQANVNIILSDKETSEALRLIDDIDIKILSELVDFNEDKIEFEVKAKPEEFAYTIFTSGSTGSPKGVVITHESVCNTVMDINERFQMNESDRVFAVSALNFDLSVFDIYGTLSSGACIVIPEEVEKKDPFAWLNTVVEQKITVWNSVPAIVNLLCNEVDGNEFGSLDSLRLIMMSGDFIPVKLTQDIRRITKNCQIISLGGATEASIWSIFYRIDDNCNVKIPYGYPLYNQRIDILDEDQQVRPDFVHGDIYIKGKGVAQGYLNDKKRTAEQFIVDKSTQEIIYKTGDIGYFNSKGYIEIVGRADEQVKIQGYRVELGEIEQELLKLDEVKECKVLDINIQNGKVLIAYIVLQYNKAKVLQTITTELSKTLPKYMIPSIVTVLDSMPLTANGKIDKKSLMDLKAEANLSTKYIAPKGEIESQLSLIFSEVLKIDKVGRNDDFFEMGGHSLLAISLMMKINKKFKTSLAFTVLFQSPNIVALTKLIKKPNEEFDIIVPIQTQGDEDPIYCVPGVGGTGLEFKLLSDVLGKNQPFFGLQSIGFDGKKKLPKSIEEIAEKNIKAIKSQQPQGPYRLIGFSFGGLVAYEMARILGEEVDVLIMLDTNASSKISVKEYIRLYVRNTPVYRRLLHFRDLIQNRKLDKTFSMKKITSNNYFCGMKYNPKPLLKKVNVNLVMAKEGHLNEKTKLGWKQSCGNYISFYEIDGGHSAMVREEEIESLGELLKKIFYKSGH